MRILLVEDDRRLASSVHRGLEEAGFSVDVAYDGEAGITGATTTPYDALILDVMLPSIDGFELVRRLRLASIPTPILMLTARDAVDDRVAGLEAGADDYLVKPFALRELIARLRALTRRHLPDRGALLTAGPIVLDTRSHQVLVREHPVEITAKEFAILECFMLHPGLLLARGQLFEHDCGDSRSWRPSITSTHPVAVCATKTPPLAQ